MEDLLFLFTLGNNELKPYATFSLSSITSANGASCGLTYSEIEDILEGYANKYVTKIDRFTYRLTDDGFDALQKLKKLKK